MSAEEWRPVVGFPGYKVSDRGRIVSLKRRAPRELKPNKNTGGYLKVTLQRAGKECTCQVHAVVAEAFLGPRPGGMQARHLDGDKLNNDAGNLAWGTPSQNVLDEVRHGTHWQARKTNCPAGHPYDEANTRHASGRRYCLPCRRKHDAARRAA